MLVVAAIAAAATACQVNQVMWAPCAPAADGNPTGADATYVLVCRNGRWEPIMTIQEYLRIRRGEWVIIGPLPQPPADPPEADPPPPPPKVVEITAGALHSCARYDDGTAKCWGSNDSGQLGNPSPTTWAPVPVNLDRIAHLVAGGQHTCAIRTDTTLWCWGRNTSGELGRGDNVGTVNPNPTPAPVMKGPNPLDGVIDVSTGDTSTCAVVDTGRVYCFGLNFFGQLGTSTNLGTFNPNSSPILVAGITAVEAVAGFADHTCALRSNDAVSCWGDNLYGQIGSGDTTSSWSPIGVNSLGIEEVAVGSLHTCAATTNARARCWGNNLKGQLGTAVNDGTHNPTTSPVEVPGLVDVGDITSGREHTCTRTTAGRVKCWGFNGFGQLGRVIIGSDHSSAPTLVDGLSDVVSVEAGSDHVCALTSSGVASCWGDNVAGQLGRSTNFGVNGANHGPLAVAGL
jgi:alpha-tubulin suppressor-like RCC1 family protein